MPVSQSIRVPYTSKVTKVTFFGIGIVRTLWVEHASDIAAEYYASVLLDRSAKKPLVMFSVEGGVDIEEVAEKTPEKLIRHHVDPLAGLTRAEALRIASEGGADPDVV